MSTYSLFLADTFEVAVGGSSTVLAATLDGSRVFGQALYQLNVSTNCWVAQGIAPTVFTAALFASGTLTATNHKLFPGDGPIQLTTTTTLPTGLALATNYWAIVVDANNFKLATSRANALAGTFIALSDAGVGVQTAQVVASAGPSCTFVPTTAGVGIFLDGGNGAQVSIIQDTVAGKASLTRVQLSR